MPDCREIILSNDYADFIMEYNIVPGEILEQYEKLCIEYIGARYSSIYVERNKIPPLTIGDYTYSAIPKLYGLMDTTAVEDTGALQLQNRPFLNLTGKGVIIGFIDTGINYKHRAFRDGSGKSRIVRIWDQTNQEGTPPAGFYFGTEFTKEDIDLALESDNPSDIVNSTDENGHGTFMAGVAAGTYDEQSDFTGAAPESYIAMVKLKPAKQYLRDFYFINEGAEAYQENDIMLAAYYLTNVAAELRMPLVIVIGLGTNSGEHAGLSPLSGLLNYMAASVGCGIVACAGNEGDKKHHFQGDITDLYETGAEDAPEEVQLRVAEGESGFLMELWGRAPDIYAVSIISPSGETVPKIPARIGQSDVLTFLFEPTVIYIDYRIVEEQTGDELIVMRFKNPTPGIWGIRVFGSNIVNGLYNIWLPISQFVMEDTYFLRPDPDITLTAPGTAENVIAVSAYNDKTNSIYVDSSRGFTRLGAIKPDFAAPGVNVFGPSNIQNNYTRKSGTSVSAALTGGVCAQFMQWGIVSGNEVNLKNNNIKTYLIRGARRDRNIVYPNREWGYGELDGYNAFEVLI